MSKGKIALWFFGILFILAGLGSFSSSLLGGFFYILGGIILLPVAQAKLSSIIGKDIAVKWFVIPAVILMVIAPIFIRASEQRALMDGTASQELIDREAKRNEYQEKERIKQEQLEATKLAEKEQRERERSSPSIKMSFDECKRRASSIQSALAGTQYKSAVHMDTSNAYEVEICTNDGRVHILCGDGEMVTIKMSRCSI